MKVNKQTKLKLRLASLFAVVAMMMPQLIQFTQSAYMMNALATTVFLPKTVATYYFAEQLDTESNNHNQRIFYQAMQTMLEKGFFRKGDVSVEVSGLSWKPGEEQALLDDMGAARDAFLLDYPELFYVDFDYLSLSIRDGAVYLGTGRGETYINKEFLKADGTVDDEKITKAIETVNSRIDTAVKNANAKSSTIDKIRSAHDAVIKVAKYTLEYQTKYPYSVRTIYGVFGLDGEGNAVCEGFARALKTILDRMGIPAVLVRGVYMDSKKVPQEHMWLYVQMEGEWHAIDVTFDNGAEDAGSGDQYEYFMVNGEKMDNHIPTGIISTSNKEFTYPPLKDDTSDSWTINENACLDTDESCAEKNAQLVYEDASGLRIEYAEEEWIGGENKGGDGDLSTKTYHISYNGKGYVEAAKDGDYIIINAWQYRENKETGKTDLLPTSWTYPTEVTDDYKKIYQDHGTYFSVKAEEYNAFQVGVTKVGFEGEPNEFNAYGVFFEGESSDIFTISQDIDTGLEIRDYPQPFVRKTTPAHTRAQTVGRTYHIEVTYDQRMELEEGKELGYTLQLFDLVYGYREPNEQTMKYKIENLKLSEDGYTITYDFTPSKMWSLDDTEYIVSFTGVYGVKSGKAPNSVNYVMFNRTTGCIYQLRAMGVDLEAFGKPTLMDDFEIDDVLSADDLGMSSEDFQEYMEQFGDLLKNRLSLVVTDPTKKEKAELDSMVDDELEEKNVLGVQTYNITLTLCAKQLESLHTGDAIRVMLGFPEGYGPEDAGVTFKAYHYAKHEQEDGTYTYEIEEIPCTITEYGLVIYVSSFSPFAVAAVKGADSGETTRAKNKITLTTTDGGKVIEKGDETQKQLEAFVMPEGKTLTAVANEGYTIDELTIRKSGENVATVITAAAGQATYDLEGLGAGDQVFVAFIADNNGSKKQYISFKSANGGEIKGGKITDLEGNEIDLSVDFYTEDGETTLKAVANEGYEIESLSIKQARSEVATVAADGAIAEAEGETEYEFTVADGQEVVVAFTKISEDPEDPNNPDDPTDPKDPENPTEGKIETGKTYTVKSTNSNNSLEITFNKALPENADHIEVKQVSKSDYATAFAEEKNLKLVYDISVLDKDNRKVSIDNNDIHIKLEVSKEELGGKFDVFSIVYIKDSDGKIDSDFDSKLVKLEQDDRYILEFTTTHLSKYGVVAYNNPTQSKPDDPNNNGGNTGGNTNTPGNPNTGTNTHIGDVLASVMDDRIYLLVAVISLIGIIIVASSKKTV